MVAGCAGLANDVGGVAVVSALVAGIGGDVAIPLAAARAERAPLAGERQVGRGAREQRADVGEGGRFSSTGLLASPLVELVDAGRTPFVVGAADLVNA